MAWQEKAMTGIKGKGIVGKEGTPRVETVGNDERNPGRRSS